MFRVFVRWANDLHSGSDKMDDILFLQESLQKLETVVLPTLGNRWVSLHPSFGLVCWADDDELKRQFKNTREVEFIQFGELSLDDKQKLDGRVAALMNIIGIPAISKVIKILHKVVKMVGYASDRNSMHKSSNNMIIAVVIVNYRFY